MPATSGLDNPVLSIIVPLLNEQEHVKQLAHRVTTIVEALGLSTELILVDDGSSDRTWREIESLTSDNFTLNAFRLSRNFGKEGAIRVGVESASGEAVVVMDGDLQHPPELIIEMVRLWKDEGYDIVDTIKKDRGEESPLYRACANSFYWLINKSSGVDLKSSSDFKLLSRKAAEALLSMRERTMFFRGMTAWLGFKHTSIPFSVPKRAVGTSSWTLRGLVKLFFDNIVSFSSVPLQIVSALGALFLLFALGLALQTLGVYLAGGAVTGFTTVILLQLIIGSCVLLGLGVIGMYVATIYEEVKGRPRYIVTQSLTKPATVQKDAQDIRALGNS